MELPDFHIPHAEKIEWMIEAEGWALEPVSPSAETDPPTPAYAYTIGLPALLEFPEIAVFGLTPVASRGLLGLVVDAVRGGTEIPFGVELVGLLAGELRCMFGPIDIATFGPFFQTANAWYQGDDYSMVQLIYPDRNGFLPYESGFEERLKLAQPVLAHFGGDS